MKLPNKTQLIGAFFYSHVWSHPGNICKFPAIVPISWHKDWLPKTWMLQLVNGVILITNFSLIAPLPHFWQGNHRKVAEIGSKLALESWIGFNAFVLN